MIVKCKNCDKEVEKRNAEYNRQIKKNPDVNFFCSRSCSTSNGNRVAPRKNAILNLENKRYAGDEYSAFKYFLNKAKNRNHDYDVDLVYLKNLWKNQNGVCAISGIQMFLPKNAVAWGKRKNDPWKPSLDRIDSSKGYVKGNVRFVCMIANLAKNSWTDDVFIEFVKKSAEFWK